MTFLMWANVALAGSAALLGLTLAVIYARNHAQIKSPFTFGLLLFGLFLVVHNGVVVYHLVTMMPQFSATGEVWLAAENVLQLGALGSLLWATLR